MDTPSDNRSDIRDFLATRRARLTPEQVGLPDGGNRRRVAGLRREEVAVLAGVSTEWYTRLEKGHISGVSEDVLEAVARALQLDDEEHTYLLDLARAARPARRTARRKPTDVPPSVQWLLDSITLSAAWVNNARLDVLAINPLGRALYSAMFTGPAAAGATGRTSPGTTSSTPQPRSSTPTGTAPPTPPSRCSAPKPDGIRTTRRSVSSSVSCPP